MNPIRIGLGFDSHRLVSSEALILGGVKIPHPQGLAGHSDGDALVHAVMDALLGAAGLGDIGSHFPSSDSIYKNIASTDLLRKVANMLSSHNWQVLNVDATIVAEQPTLAPHIPAMRTAIAEATGISLDQVSVKATSTDGLGFVGRTEGIAAMAVALISLEQ